MPLYATCNCPACRGEGPEERDEVEFDEDTEWEQHVNDVITSTPHGGRLLRVIRRLGRKRYNHLPNARARLAVMWERLWEKTAEEEGPPVQRP
jgi:hypothetical protein